MKSKDDLWRRWVAKAYDGISFGMINALHLRGAAGFCSLEEMEAYIEQLEAVPIDEFYRIPEEAGSADIPELGHRFLDSPRPYDCEENNQVSLEYWPGPDGWNSPVMFLLHGVMSVSDVGYKLWAKKLNALGWGVIFFHLPYHYGRRPKKAMSGEMALTSNIIRTTEGIRQAVIEMRWINQALRERGVPAIGIWATSYGGWIGSLLAVLENDVRMVMLLEPIVDVDIAIWESPATRTLRRQLRQRGITRDLLRRLVPVACPTHHQPKLDPDKILLAAGQYDEIAPTRTIRALQQHWCGSHYIELPQGHVGYQLMPESLKWARNRWPELFTESQR